MFITQYFCVTCTTNRQEILVRWGSFEKPDGIYKAVEMPRVFGMALNTWADWLEVHINRTKTQLFFVSLSPTHQKYYSNYSSLLIKKINLSSPVITTLFIMHFDFFITFKSIYFKIGKIIKPDSIDLYFF